MEKSLERRGMNLGRSKTEYMFVNERETSVTVKEQETEVVKAVECKYPCTKEVKKSMQAGGDECGG